MSTSGGVNSSFSDPVCRARSTSRRVRTTLWFTNFGNNSIGRITTSGYGTISNYADASISGPQGITTGPDGGVWFANNSGNSIGRVGATACGQYRSPYGIAAGPDGAMWFTDAGVSSIWRVSSTGTFSRYFDATVDQPIGIAVGPDGGLWFTNFGSEHDRPDQHDQTMRITHFTGDISVSRRHGGSRRVRTEHCGS